MYWTEEWEKSNKKMRKIRQHFRSFDMNIL
jgi:hypothetical protein